MLDKKLTVKVEITFEITTQDDTNEVIRELGDELNSFPLIAMGGIMKVTHVHEHKNIDLN